MFLSTHHLHLLCVRPLLLSLILLRFSALLPPPPLYIHCCLTAPPEPACGAVEPWNRGTGEGNNRKHNRKHTLCAALELNIVNMQVREGKTSVMHACLHTDLTPIRSTPIPSTCHPPHTHRGSIPRPALPDGRRPVAAGGGEKDFPTSCLSSESLPAPQTLDLLLQPTHPHCRRRGEDHA